MAPPPTASATLTPLVLGSVRKAPMSKSGLPCLIHGFGAKTSVAAGDEGAEGRDAVGVGGDELEVAGPGAACPRPRGPVLTQWPAVRTSCRVGLLIAVPEQ